MWNEGLTTSIRGDWKTPRALYAQLVVEPKRFDVSDRHGGGFDALRDPWPIVWYANPPYGREIATWVRLMPNKGPGVALLPARTDTKWFHDYIYHRAEIVFLKGRLHFDDLGPAPFPSMLVYFGGLRPDVLSDWTI